jgi:H(+)-transporting ATP synthase subunit D
MSRMNVPPTRSNLLRLKQELEFAREGFEILDKKREVLSAELVHLAHDADVLQRLVWDLLTAAYQALERAKLTMGQERVEWAALAVNKTVEVEIKSHGVMGVPIPIIQALQPGRYPGYARRSERRIPRGTEPRPRALRVDDLCVAAGQGTAQDAAAGQCLAVHLYSRL